MNKKQTNVVAGDVFTLKFEAVKEGPEGKCDGCHFANRSMVIHGPKDNCLSIINLLGLPSCKFSKIVYELKK